MNNNDQDLVNRFLKSRSENDFKALYRKFSDRLYRIAFMLSKKDDQLAADILQETWITTIAKLSQFQWKSKLETWLTGILINKFREQIRKSGALSEPEDKVIIENAHVRMDLEKAILSLPQGYREILVMHDLEGFKHHEIAEALGISEGTSKSQLYQARKKMRTLIKDYQYENE